MNVLIVLTPFSRMTNITMRRDSQGRAVFNFA